MAEDARFLKSGPARIADLERRLVVAEQNAASSARRDGSRGDSNVLGASEQIENGSTAVVLSAGEGGLVIENHSFRPGDVVMTPETALVGIVERAGVWSARVTRPSDSVSRVRVMVESSDGSIVSEGEVYGEFGGSIVLDRVVTAAELSPNQRVVTSGDDDAAPAGLLIGWIGRVIEKNPSSVYQRALVDPAAAVRAGSPVVVLMKEPR